MSEHAEPQEEELKKHGDPLQGALESGKREQTPGTGSPKSEADSKQKE